MPKTGAFLESLLKICKVGLGDDRRPIKTIESTVVLYLQATSFLESLLEATEKLLADDDLDWVAVEARCELLKVCTV